MKLGILTSSRADFGIYLPLIKKLFVDSFFNPEIIAFGTHLSKKFGNTINEILKQGFPVKHQLNTIPTDDSPVAISESIGETIKIFSGFWKNEKFDFVFVLGDRYEMFAAVTAGIPFNVKFAHIHAGETTLGAIDNAYRHSISLMSDLLIVTTDEYKKRTIEVIQKPENVFNVGALSIDNLKKVELYNIEEFKKAFNIDLSQPTILSTFHPETVDFKKNRVFIKELLSAFNILKKKYQIIITMPNSDTMGLMIRDEIEKFANHKENIILVESFGMKGYLSCMKHCSFLLGNTSSGFVEAVYFPKWVINIGDRQKGRIITPNIKNIPVIKENILETVDEIEHLKMPSFKNPYYNGGAANEIIKILKSL
jgi:GDP/UDP-N,N'-diacetylbacillosamine 2-epimerase (hydrolysing)